ncbi:MAG: sugar phosphate isomerase/epimerase family protein [Gammaproteobacteria bacterium]|jgi:sugar phosphate isomerase/epimerase|nr:sugar phosphate isomerase/epimerase family protein [Gammaproteobacteria bacterium]
MRFGCCSKLERLEATREAGFDYAEMQVGVLEPEAAESKFAETRRRIADVGLPVEAFNVFISPTLPVVGERIDRQRLDAYLDTALARMQEVGASIVVFGSGGARSTPRGFDRRQAMDQIADFLHTVAEKLDRTELTLAIEPLYKIASDNINTVEDALKMARRVDHPRIKVLADMFHMAYEDDKPENLFEARADLRHVHVPVPQLDGMSPRLWDELYVEFLGALRSAGYDARISIEDNGGRFQDFQTEARQALEYLKDSWAE